VHLVTRGNFRSHDKDGGHTNRSAISENPMLHANFVALCFVEPELLPIEVLHCGNRDFRPFCSCDLDLDPMTFIYELDPYSLMIPDVQIWTPYIKAFESYHSTDRQTRPKLYTKPLCGWSTLLCCILFTALIV